jgi:fermentation-respiration switch protein FrsA (DUF1100 family)
MRAFGSGLSAVIVIALAATSFGCLERKLLFPMPPTPIEAPAFDTNTKHAWLQLAGGHVEAFLLLPEPARQTPAPLIVYAHGNGEIVDYWLSEFAEFRARGIAILLVEYPGYGRGTGTPSEKSIQTALAAGYDWAASQPEVDPHRIVGYGHSLGGGAICDLARVRPLAALVLESTFTSVRDVAAERFHVPRFIIRNGFENIDFVRDYQAPVLVLHGEGDDSIPVSHAHRLAEAAPNAELELIPCGHSDCPRPWPTLTAFLGKHGLL